MGLYRACYIVNWISVYFTDGEGPSAKRTHVQMLFADVFPCLHIGLENSTPWRDSLEGKWVAWLGGFIQTFLYLDFFYYYAKAKW